MNNHEKAVEEREKLDFLKIDWEKEIAQQKINSRDEHARELQKRTRNKNFNQKG